MSEVLDRVRAQMEHFRDTGGLDEDDVSVDQIRNEVSIRISVGSTVLQLIVMLTDEYFSFYVYVVSEDHEISPKMLAELGGRSIQLSNLMAQIQALAPEVPSGSAEQSEAVG